MLITGRLERLPRASTIPNGKARAIPVHPKTSVTSKPPHLLVETDSRPNPPFQRKKAITGKTYVNFKKCFLNGNLSNNNGTTATANII